MSDTEWQIGAPLITLDEARDLVMLLEAGMQDEADDQFVALAKRIDKSGRADEIFNEVGNLTRGLHDAIRSFVEDPRIKVIAGVEFPDASERLRYIIKMTDKAATRTLDAIDLCSPLATKLSNSIEKLMPVWTRLMHGHIDRFEFVNLCHQVDELLSETKDDASLLSKQLTEILMAQDYQDLTGQMLQKVIGLVGEVEDKLVNFLVAVGTIPATKDDTSKSTIDAEGPALASAKQSKDVASSQDDVDDLLASLGF